MDSPAKDDPKRPEWKWSERRFQWVLGGDDIDEETQAGVDTILNMNAFHSSGMTNLTEVRDTSEHIAVFNLPLYGRIHFVKHKPGWIHISIIVLYWLYGNWSTFTYLTTPHVAQGHISNGFTYVHIFFALMTIVSLFRASTLNPGRMPIRGQKDRPPKPNSPPGEMDYCQNCLQNRPWKSHHCRVCGQCVKRMDHHCPWINNCVGEENHFAFLQLTVYATLMSGWVFLMLMMDFYYWPELADIPDNFAWNHKKGFKTAILVMSALMATLMSCLSLTQHVGIVLGLTTIDWKSLEAKIKKVGFFKMDMLPRKPHGCVRMYKDFCGPGSILMWIFPCRKKVILSSTSYV